MSNLRTKMTQDMIVRGLAKSTQKAYLHAVIELSDYYNQRNPASLSKQELLDYLVHLSQERGLAWGTCNGRVHALRFFYQVTLGRTDVINSKRKFLIKTTRPELPLAVRSW